MNRTPICSFAAILLATLVVVSGCGGESKDSETSSPQAGNEQPGQTPPKVELPSDELSAAHILIMYRGSERAPRQIVRSKTRALELAEEIASEAKGDGADFAALAKEHSDCPSGRVGGNLGLFQPDGMAPAFSEATAKLAVGEISDPVETPFGYHIILRQEIKTSP